MAGNKIQIGVELVAEGFKNADDIVKQVNNMVGEVQEALDKISGGDGKGLKVNEASLKKMKEVFDIFRVWVLRFQDAVSSLTTATANMKITVDEEGIAQIEQRLTNIFKEVLSRIPESFKTAGSKAGESAGAAIKEAVKGVSTEMAQQAAQVAENASKVKSSKQSKGGIDEDGSISDMAGQVNKKAKSLSDQIERDIHALNRIAGTLTGSAEGKGDRAKIRKRAQRIATEFGGTLQQAVAKVDLDVLSQMGQELRKMTQRAHRSYSDVSNEINRLEGNLDNLNSAEKNELATLKRKKKVLEGQVIPALAKYSDWQERQYRTAKESIRINRRVAEVAAESASFTKKAGQELVNAVKGGDLSSLETFMEKYARTGQKIGIQIRTVMKHTESLKTAREKARAQLQKNLKTLRSLRSENSKEAKQLQETIQFQQARINQIGKQIDLNEKHVSSLTKQSKAFKEGMRQLRAQRDMMTVYDTAVRNAYKQNNKLRFSTKALNEEFGALSTQLQKSGGIMNTAELKAAKKIITDISSGIKRLQKNASEIKIGSQHLKTQIRNTEPGQFAGGDKERGQKIKDELIEGVDKDAAHRVAQIENEIRELMVTSEKADDVIGGMINKFDHLVKARSAVDGVTQKVKRLRERLHETSDMQIFDSGDLVQKGRALKKVESDFFQLGDAVREAQSRYAALEDKSTKAAKKLQSDIKGMLYAYDRLGSEMKKIDDQSSLIHLARELQGSRQKVFNLADAFRSLTARMERAQEGFQYGGTSAAVAAKDMAKVTKEARSQREKLYGVIQAFELLEAEGQELSHTHKRILMDARKLVDGFEGLEQASRNAIDQKLYKSIDQFDASAKKAIKTAGIIGSRFKNLSKTVMHTGDDFIRSANHARDVQKDYKKLENTIAELVQEYTNLSARNGNHGEQARELRILIGQMVKARDTLRDLMSTGQKAQKVRGIQAMGEDVQEANGKVVDLQTRFERMARSMQKAQHSIGKGGVSTLVAAQEMKKLGKDAKSMRMAAERVIQTFDHLERVNNGLTKAEERHRQSAIALKSAFGQMGASVDNQRVKLDRLEKQLKSTGGGFKMFRADMADSIVNNFKFITAIGLVMSAIFGLRTAFMELMEESRAFGRLLTVTNSEVKSITEAFEMLKVKVRELAIEFGETVEQVSEVAKQFQSAGLSAEATMSGLADAMKLITATQADAETAARSIAGVYNVFGDQLSKTGNEAEKFRNITEVLAKSYRTHQVELDEMTEGLKFVTATGRTAGFQFHELAALVSVLNDNMIKSGRAGRSLQRVFSQFAAKGEQFKEALNLDFEIDPNESINKQFVKVLEGVNKGLKTGAINAKQLETNFRLFGLRGAPAFTTLALKVNEVKEVMEDFGDTSTSELDEISSLVRNTLVKRFEAAKQALLEIVRNGLEPAKEALIVFADAIKQVQEFLKATGLDQFITHLVIFGGVAVIAWQSLVAILQVLFAFSVRLKESILAIRGFNTSLRMNQLELTKTQIAALKTAGAYGTLETAMNGTSKTRGKMNKGILFGLSAPQVAAIMIALTVLAAIIAKVHKSMAELEREFDDISASLNGFDRQINDIKELREEITKIGDTMDSTAIHTDVAAQKIRDAFKKTKTDLASEAEILAKSNEELVAQFGDIEARIMEQSRVRQDALASKRLEKQKELDANILKQAEKVYEINDFTISAGTSLRILGSLFESGMRIIVDAIVSLVMKIDEWIATVPGQESGQKEASAQPSREEVRAKFEKNAHRLPFKASPELIESLVDAKMAALESEGQDEFSKFVESAFFLGDWFDVDLDPVGQELDMMLQAMDELQATREQLDMASLTDPQDLPRLEAQLKAYERLVASSQGALSKVVEVHKGLLDKAASSGNYDVMKEKLNEKLVETLNGSFHLDRSEARRIAKMVQNSIDNRIFGQLRNPDSSEYDFNLETLGLMDEMLEIADAPIDGSAYIQIRGELEGLREEAERTKAEFGGIAEAVSIAGSGTSLPVLEGQETFVDIKQLRRTITKEIANEGILKNSADAIPTLLDSLMEGGFINEQQRGAAVEEFKNAETEAAGLENVLNNIVEDMIVLDENGMKVTDTFGRTQIKAQKLMLLLQNMSESIADTDFSTLGALDRIEEGSVLAVLDDRAKSMQNLVNSIRDGIRAQATLNDMQLRELELSKAVQDLDRKANLGLSANKMIEKLNELKFNFEFTPQEGGDEDQSIEDRAKAFSDTVKGQMEFVKTLAQYDKEFAGILKMWKEKNLAIMKGRHELEKLNEQLRIEELNLTDSNKSLSVKTDLLMQNIKHQLRELGAAEKMTGIKIESVEALKQMKEFQLELLDIQLGLNDAIREENQMLYDTMKISEEILNPKQERAGLQYEILAITEEMDGLQKKRAKFEEQFKQGKIGEVEYERQLILNRHQYMQLGKQINDLQKEQKLEEKEHLKYVDRRIGVLEQISKELGKQADIFRDGISGGLDEMLGLDELGSLTTLAAATGMSLYRALDDPKSAMESFNEQLKNGTLNMSALSGDMRILADRARDYYEEQEKINEKLEEMYSIRAQGALASFDRHLNSGDLDKAATDLDKLQEFGQKLFGDNPEDYLKFLEKMQGLSKKLADEQKDKVERELKFTINVDGENILQEALKDIQEEAKRTQEELGKLMAFDPNDTSKMAKAVKDGIKGQREALRSVVGEEAVEKLRSSIEKEREFLQKLIDANSGVAKEDALNEQVVNANRQIVYADRVDFMGDMNVPRHFGDMGIFDPEQMDRLSGLIIAKESSGNFGAVRDDRDLEEGVGMAYGLFQNTLSGGALGQLLDAAQSLDPDKFREIFGENTDKIVELTNSTSRSVRLSQETLDLLYSSDVEKSLNEFGKVAKFQQLQMQYAQSHYLKPMLEWMNDPEKNGVGEIALTERAVFTMWREAILNGVTGAQDMAAANSINGNNSALSGMTPRERADYLVNRMKLHDDTQEKQSLSGVYNLPDKLLKRADEANVSLEKTTRLLEEQWVKGEARLIANSVAKKVGYTGSSEPNLAPPERTSGQLMVGDGLTFVQRAQELYSTTDEFMGDLNALRGALNTPILNAVDDMNRSWMEVMGFDGLMYGPRAMNDQRGRLWDTSRTTPEQVTRTNVEQLLTDIGAEVVRGDNEAVASAIQLADSVRGQAEAINETNVNVKQLLDDIGPYAFESGKRPKKEAISAAQDYGSQLVDATKEQTQAINETNINIRQLLDDIGPYAFRSGERDRDGQMALQNTAGSFMQAFKTLADVLPVKRQTGGSIPGFGGGDKVPALLEMGEYVIPKEMVKRYGVGFFEAIRTGQLDPSMFPGYEEGGFLSSLLNGAASGNISSGSSVIDSIATMVNRLINTAGLNPGDSKVKEMAVEAGTVTIRIDSVKGAPKELKDKDKDKDKEGDLLSATEKILKDRSLVNGGEEQRKILKRVGEDIAKMKELANRSTNVRELGERLQEKFPWIGKLKQEIQETFGSLGKLTDTFFSEVYSPRFIEENTKVWEMYVKQLREVEKQYQVNTDTAIDGLKKNSSSYYAYLNQIEQAEKQRIQGVLSAQKQYRDSLKKTEDVIRDQFKSLWASISKPEDVENAVGAFSDALFGEFGSSFDSMIGQIALEFPSLFTDIDPISNNTKALPGADTGTKRLAVLETDTGALDRIADALTGGSSGSVMEMLGLGNLEKSGGFKVASSVMDTLGSGLMAAAGPIMGTVTGGISEIVNMSLNEDNGKKMVDFLDKFIEEMPEKIEEFSQAFTRNLDRVVTAIAESLPGIMKTLMKELPKILTSIVDNLERALPKIVDAFVEALPKLVERIVPLIVRMFVIIIKELPKIMLGVIKSIPSLIGGVFKGLFGGIFHDGGVIGGKDEEALILAQRGEGVLSRKGMQALGGEGVLNALNSGAFNLEDLDMVNQVPVFHEGGIVDKASADGIDTRQDVSRGPKKGSGGDGTTVNQTFNNNVTVQGDVSDKNVKKLAREIRKEVTKGQAKDIQDRKGHLYRVMKK